MVPIVPACRSTRLSAVQSDEVGDQGSDLVKWSFIGRRTKHMDGPIRGEGR